jgi:hypothetical protein
MATGIIFRGLAPPMRSSPRIYGKSGGTHQNHAEKSNRMACFCEMSQIVMSFAGVSARYVHMI